MRAVILLISLLIALPPSPATPQTIVAENAAARVVVSAQAGTVYPNDTRRAVVGVTIIPGLVEYVRHRRENKRLEAMGASCDASGGSSDGEAVGSDPRA